MKRRLTYTSTDRGQGLTLDQLDRVVSDAGNLNMRGWLRPKITLVTKGAAVKVGEIHTLTLEDRA